MHGLYKFTKWFIDWSIAGILYFTTCYWFHHQCMVCTNFFISYILWLPPPIRGLVVHLDEKSSWPFMPMFIVSHMVTSHSGFSTNTIIQATSMCPLTYSFWVILAWPCRVTPITFLGMTINILLQLD